MIVTVAKVKSAFRLVALDPQALALDLRPGTALADARAMHPTLDVHEADPAGDAEARDALVDWCRLFTPLAAPDGADGAILDITGAAHLFGGEATLIDTLSARLAAQGVQSRIAVAATPGAAWAFARYGNGRRLVDAAMTPVAYAGLVATMPLAALRLDAATIAQLDQAGLRRVADLMLRPRAPIAARFGSHIHHRIDILLGRARDPISPRFAAPPFLAERRFSEGIVRREDVEATILALAHDLCGLLARHGEGARQLDVSLFRVDGVVKHLKAGTSRPLRDPAAMARLFRERIETAGEEGLDTGYGFDVVRLAALAAERLDPAQSGWGAAAMDETELADLVDRLGARFGLGRVTRMTLADSHQPERAAAAMPAVFPSPDPSRACPTWALSKEEIEQARSLCGRRCRGEAVTDEGTLSLLQNPSSDPRFAKATFSRSKSGLPDLSTLERRDRASPISLREKEELLLPDRPIRLLDRPEPIDAIAEIPDGPPRRFRWRRVMHQVAAIEGPERIGADWWRPGTGFTRDYFRAEDTDGRRFWLYREGLYHEVQEPCWFLHGLFA